jgi:HEAT repeat protein
VCLALLAPAQTKAVDARLAGLVAALGDTANPQARSNAYMSLLREKPVAVLPLLVDALPRFDVQGQQYGLWIVQLYKPEESKTTLHKLVLEKSALLQAGAAAKLLEQGEHEMLEPLVKAFARKDTPADVRRAMLQQIYLVKEPRVAAAVRTWLAPETEPWLLGDVLYHLRNINDLEAKPKVLDLAAAPGLAAESRAVCAAYLLALGDDAQGRVLAEQLANDEGPLFSRLQRFFLGAPRLPEELVAAIAAIAERSSVPAYAQMALVVLGQHAGPKQMPVIEKLLDSPNALIAKAALEALQRRGGSLPRESLVRMLASPDAQRALSAADALRRIDDLAGFARVLEIARAGGPDKAEALRVLAKFRSKQCIAPLVDGLEDADLSVRSAAEQGLLTLLPSMFPYRRFDLASSGYTAGAAPEQRAAALQKIRAWCAANLKG